PAAALLCGCIAISPCCPCLKELAIMRHADMFEHADGDDTIVAAGLFPIVAQMEPHALTVMAPPALSSPEPASGEPMKAPVNGDDGGGGRHGRFFECGP